jgi:hypothetical protein
MTITVCASQGKRSVSAMKARSPLPGLLGVDQIFSARLIGLDQRRFPAFRPRVAVRVTLAQVSAC